jgi:glycosyltransferase involved in cell wall biosynthesis
MEAKRIKILYLYAEIMGYNVAVFKEYIRNYPAEVHVVHWDQQKKTPYVPPELDKVFYYGKSQFESTSLLQFVMELQPNIIFTSGWMDRDYLKVCLKLRKKEIPIIALSDTSYQGTWRQRLGSIYFKVFYRKAFDYLWVAGAYQYEYGKRLGFRNSEILFNSLTADLAIFNGIYHATITDKEKKYPHQFLFVGRFAKEKGLDVLIEAWDKVQYKKDWTLRFVGNGPMKAQIPQQRTVDIHDFVQPDEFEALVAQAGCLILPSIQEPWALVLHEFAAAGLPIICSDACGAMPVFVISGYNGYTFASTKVSLLQEAMQKIINSSDDELLNLSQRSHQLGQRIDPETTAARSLSVLK